MLRYINIFVESFFSRRYSLKDAFLNSVASRPTRENKCHITYFNNYKKFEIQYYDNVNDLPYVELSCGKIDI